MRSLRSFRRAVSLAVLIICLVVAALASPEPAKAVAAVPDKAAVLWNSQPAPVYANASYRPSYGPRHSARWHRPYYA